MEVMQAIKERRSVRRYKTDPVPEELLRTVLEAARWAPSWANSQCWRFIVVADPELKAKIAGTLRSASPERPNRAQAAILNAPLVIVACAELGKSGFRSGVPQTDKGDWFMFDVALAMQNLALAAHALGLGTVHVGNFDALAAKELVGLPPEMAVVELTPLGYPDEQPKAPPRREIKELAFLNTYSVPLE